MNYHVVEESSIDKLMRRVNQMIDLKIGWRPIGGPFAVRQTVSGPMMYCQALENIPGSEPAINATWPIRGVYKRKRQWHKKPKEKEVPHDPSPVAQGG